MGAVLVPVSQEKIKWRAGSDPITVMFHQSGCSYVRRGLRCCSAEGSGLSPKEVQVPSNKRGCSGQLLCNYSPMGKKKKMIIINKIKVSLDRDSAGHLMGGHETEAKFVNTGTEQEFQGDANHFSIALTAVSPSTRCNFF